MPLGRTVFQIEPIYNVLKLAAEFNTLLSPVIRKEDENNQNLY